MSIYCLSIVSIVFFCFVFSIVSLLSMKPNLKTFGPVTLFSKLYLYIDYLKKQRVKKNYNTVHRPIPSRVNINIHSLKLLETHEDKRYVQIHKSQIS